MAAWRAVQSNRTRQPLQEIGGTEANFLCFSHCVAFYVWGGSLTEKELTGQVGEHSLPGDQLLGREDPSTINFM